MNIVIASLFSTALFYACVNGGAIRAQESNGAWSGPEGYSGAPRGLAGPTGYAGGPGGLAGPAEYAGGPGLSGGWQGPGGYAGASGTPGGWTGPAGYAGAPGGLAGPAGYAGGPGLPGGLQVPGGYAGGSGTPGGWAGPAGYASSPGLPGGWQGQAAYAGTSGAHGGWTGRSGFPGGPGSQGLAGNGNPSGAPIGYSGPTALPEVLPDGTLADVPEVAAARAAHLAATQAAASDPRAADADDGEYNVHKYGDQIHFQQDHHSTGPAGYHGSGFGPVAPFATQGGAFNDDAAWRVRQAALGQQTAYQNPRDHSYANAEGALNLLVAKNAAAAATSSGVSGEPVRPYSGPLATPQVLPSGYIADTEEVVVARQNHLRALAEAESAAAQWEQRNPGWN